MQQQLIRQDNQNKQQVDTICSIGTFQAQWRSGWHSGSLAERSGFRITAMPLFYRVATSGKLFTHIASPVFSAPRNWGTKGRNWTNLTV